MFLKMEVKMIKRKNGFWISRDKVKKGEYMYSAYISLFDAIRGVPSLYLHSLYSDHELKRLYFERSFKK